MSKVCSKCNTEKNEEDFYVVEKSEDGNHRRNSVCKACVLEYNRKRYSDNPEYKHKRQEREKKRQENPEVKEASQKRSADFYKSISGRAKTLYKSATRRAVKYEEFDLTVNWIEDKLKSGFCEITHLPFDLSQHPKYEKNPFAPSIDRRDSSKGYTKENTRVVIWQVNLLRGEMNDEEILDVCIRVVEGLKHGLDV